jgi:hypothetical protein
VLSQGHNVDSARPFGAILDAELDLLTLSEGAEA